MSKSHEQAIESSPMGEHAPTSSRPPTRARGYSSTLSLAGRKGDNSSKIPGTPGFESSVLSNFRRRARQPSILQMMQAEDRSSDLDDDDFLGGLSPEDESTPLNVSRGKSLIRNAASSSPKSLSRNSSRKRKWTDEELQVPQSPLGVVESTPIGSPIPQTQRTESRTRTSVSRAVESTEVLGQTMAPPMSSSAPQSPAQTALMPTLDRASPATSERSKAPNEVVPDDLEHLSTTSLQKKLLPRRRKPRRKPRGATNIDLESDDSEADARDDDASNYMSGRKPIKSQRTQTNKSKPLAKTHAKPDKNKNSVSKSNEGVMSAGKENQPTDMSSPLSSALDSDELDSDTGEFISDELRIQAKKFAEVDKWQMDFEDVISTMGSQGSSFR